MYACSTASKWEYRTPTSRFPRKKRTAVLESAGPAEFESGARFFRGNGEVGEIKMALCVFVVCCANWRVRHNNGQLLYGTKAGLVCELFGLNKKRLRGTQNL